MFAPRYFAARYFAPRYWPPGGFVILIPVARGGSRSPPSPLWWKRMQERTKIWEREKYTVEEMQKDALMTQIMMEDEEIVDLIIMLMQVIDNADT